MIFKIIGVAICTIIGCLIVKNVKPELSILVGLSGGIIILLFIGQMLGDVFYNFNQIVEQTGVSNDIFKVLMKVVGIGYLTEFTSSMCQDTGNSNLSEYVCLGGRVVILILCFPIFKTLLNLVVGLL